MKKRKKKGKLIFFLILFVIVIKVGTEYLDQLDRQQTEQQPIAVKLDKMKSNGIANLKIIDLSDANTVTDWSQLKAQVDGAYIKATEGATYINPKFKKYALNALYKNIPVGFYHYFWPHGNVVDARQQAIHFYNAIRQFNYKLYPVLDIEEDNQHTSQEVCADVIAFANEFKALSGHSIMIYSYPDYADRCLQDSRLSAYPLWIANYKVKQPNDTMTWHKYAMWQYSDTTYVNGISNAVDGDLATVTIFLNPLSAPKK